MFFEQSYSHTGQVSVQGAFFALGPMSDDTKELNNFVLMAKTTKGLACAALIKQVLDHPSIYVFGELLDMPNVAEVRALTRVLNTRS